MAETKALLKGRAIAAALLTALLLVALPQAAWAEETESTTGESAISTVSDNVASADEPQGADVDAVAAEAGGTAAISVGDTNEIDAAGDAEQADEDASSCQPEQGDEDTTSGQLEQADEASATSCYPEQVSASKDLDAADADGTTDAAADQAQTVTVQETQGHWVVSDLDNGYGLQRYWYDASGNMAVDRLVTPEEGAGYYAYATKYGYVVRGTYDNGAGRVYLADNDGKLEEASGWLVTGKYTGGELQRYYIEDHAARTSYFTVDGAAYFGRGGVGYVLRGAGSGYNSESQASQLYADNDGKLATSQWLCTDAFGQGFQRYWFDSTSAMAKSRLINPTTVLDKGSYYAYATSDGPILRTVWDNGAGRVYLADNDGLLAEGKTGWLVTGAYTGGALQRYYIDSETHAAKTSYFTVDGAAYFGQGGVGYVLRGAGSGFNAESVWSTLYADNDGKLATSQWLCTDAFGQGLQRYWFDSTSAMAKGRLIDPTNTLDKGAYYAYATSDGYVLRGKLRYGDGMLLADNDGLLAEGKTGWLVTGSYTDGDAQRYYIDPSTHAAVTGFFQAKMDDSELWFYGVSGAGYVVRGKYSTDNGMLIADNDGVLLENDYSTAGMYVSSLWDSEPQRYYLEEVDGHIYAKTGFFAVDGYGDCYGWEDKGYLARNCEVTVGTALYSADNDGKLTYLREIVTRTRDTYLANPTWTGDVSYIAELREKADASADSSKTYCAVIDDTLCRVVIFKRSGDSWVAAQLYNCNGGRAHYTGVFSVKHKNKCNWDDSYFGKGYNDWATDYIEGYSPTNSTGHYRYVEGKGYECCAGFHSTGYTTTGWNNSGCIGLQYDDAKWVYDNIDIGASVIIF